MFISTAAVALDKYEWFKYTSVRKQTFDNHNSRHDLVLEKGDIFGIRYSARTKTYKLLDFSAPKIVFTFNEAEYRRVVRLSIGVSPRYQGKVLPKGVGGKDTEQPRQRKIRSRREEVPEENTQQIEETSDNVLYPRVSMPPTKAEISRLYTLFNRQHFRGECPDLKKVVIQLSSAIRFLGQASLRFVYKQPVYKLKMAKKGFTDPKRVINILLHEMVHLLHYKRAYEDHDRAYVEVGHGPVFLEEMERLNSLGYALSVVDDGMPIKATLAEPVYVLMFHYKIGGWSFIKEDTGTDSWFFVWSNNNFDHNIDFIISEIQSKFNLNFVKYIYGKTDCSHAYLGRELTRDGTLPRRSTTFRPFSPTDEDGILKQLIEETDVIKEQSLKVDSGDKNIRDIIIKTVNGLYAKIAEESWFAFLATVVSYALSIDSSEVISGEVYSKITEDERAFIHSRWMDVKPVNFLKSSKVANTKRFLIKHRLDGIDAVDFLIAKYSGFRERIEPEQAADLLIEMYGSILTITNKEIRSRVMDRYKK